MKNRMLHEEDIAPFQAWMFQCGYSPEKPKGEWEVLRFSDRNGQTISLYKNKRNARLTAPEGEASRLVQQYYNEELAHG